MTDGVASIPTQPNKGSNTSLFAPSLVLYPEDRARLSQLARLYGGQTEAVREALRVLAARPVVPPPPYYIFAADGALIGTAATIEEAQAIWAQHPIIYPVVLEADGRPSEIDSMAGRPEHTAADQRVYLRWVQRAQLSLFLGVPFTDVAYYNKVAQGWHGAGWYRRDGRRWAWVPRATVRAASAMPRQALGFDGPEVIHG